MLERVYLDKTDGRHVRSDGTVIWYLHGKVHRDDGPAVEFDDGTMQWYQNGLLHRDSGPAIVYPTGRKAWYKEGKLHRDGGPAVEWEDGKKEYYINGVKVGQRRKRKIRKEFFKNLPRSGYIE